MWLGTGALNHLIKTSTVAPTDLVNIKVDGLVAISSGTLFQFNGISNTFEFSRGDWAHQDAPGAGASPIVCAGNGGVYVLNFRESRLSWRLVNAGWQDMISIADTTAGDIDFSCSFDDNEMYLAYESTTVRPTLIHLPALGGATSFKGRGLHFSGNSYHVAADGATSYANAWRVIWNQILSAYQSSGAIYDSSYEAIDEKIFLVGNTLSASHAEGVACAESAYVVRGLTFECFRPTTARELRVSALTVGGTANYGVEIRGVVFPHIVHSGGVVSSKHQIAVAAKKSIMISDIENAAMDGDYAIACLISDDDCRVDVRGANGRVSGVGCLAKIDDLGNNDANVMVSGLHATDTADANGLTAVMIASGTGGKSFCVGCCQHGGNPAVSSGFDISNNYYLP